MNREANLESDIEVLDWVEQPAFMEAETEWVDAVECESDYRYEEMVEEDSYRPIDTTDLVVFSTEAQNLGSSGAIRLLNALSQS